MYPVEKMCKTMKVSKNAYYHWFKNKDVIVSKTAKIFINKKSSLFLSKIDRYMVTIGFKKN